MTKFKKIIYDKYEIEWDTLDYTLKEKSITKWWIVAWRNIEAWKEITTIIWYYPTIARALLKISELINVEWDKIMLKDLASTLKKEREDFIKELEKITFNK